MDRNPMITFYEKQKCYKQRTRMSRRGRQFGYRKLRKQRANYRASNYKPFDLKRNIICWESLAEIYFSISIQRVLGRPGLQVHTCKQVRRNPLKVIIYLWLLPHFQYRILKRCVRLSLGETQTGQSRCKHTLS